MYKSKAGIWTKALRQGRGRLKIFINLKLTFCPFVLFYYLHNYLKYNFFYLQYKALFLIILLGGEGGGGQPSDGGGGCLKK